MLHINAIILALIVFTYMSFVLYMFIILRVLIKLYILHISLTSGIFVIAIYFSYFHDNVIMCVSGLFHSLR